MLYFDHVDKMEESFWPNKCRKIEVDVNSARGRPRKYEVKMYGKWKSRKPAKS